MEMSERSRMPAADQRQDRAFREPKSNELIRTLRSYRILEGTRGQEGVNIPMFSEAVRRVSALCQAAPEIFEMDINPLMAGTRQITAVDARIRIEKER